MNYVGLHDVFGPGVPQPSAHFFVIWIPSTETKFSQKCALAMENLTI